MKKTLLAILVLVGTCFAIDNYTQPQTFTSQQVLTSDQLNSVVDTPHAWTEKLCDTLNQGDIARYSRIVNDSTFDTIRVNYVKSLNTIRGNPDIDSADVTLLLLDSAKGYPYIDSIETDYLNADKIFTDSIKLKTYAETLVVDDSLYASKIESPSIKVDTDIFTIAWTDYSSSSTVTGFSSTSYEYIYYKQVGKLIFVNFYIYGTSNATTFSFTVPSSAAGQAVYTRWNSAVECMDNAVTSATPGKAEINAGDSTVTIYTDYDDGGWTDTNTKGAAGQIWFEAQ